MTKRSSRDIEFAVRLAIDALRREIDRSRHPRQLAFDDRVFQPDTLVNGNVPQPDNHRRDLERAIAVLKAIKAGVYDSG